jgi:hypothetical protein
MKNQQDIWKKMTTPIEIEPYLNEPFESVKARFDAHVIGGYCVKCPMSGTVHNMPYRRTISKGMARAMKQIYRIQVNGINNGVAPNQFADFTKLRHWGLIKQGEESSHWIITETGIDFARGSIGLPKYAVVVNNVLKQFLGDNLTIDEILSK